MVKIVLQVAIRGISNGECSTYSFSVSKYFKICQKFVRLAMTNLSKSKNGLVRGYLMRLSSTPPTREKPVPGLFDFDFVFDFDFGSFRRVKSFFALFGVLVENIAKLVPSRLRDQDGVLELTLDL